MASRRISHWLALSYCFPTIWLCGMRRRFLVMDNLLMVKRAGVLLTLMAWYSSENLELDVVDLSFLCSRATPFRGEFPCLPAVVPLHDGYDNNWDLAGNYFANESREMDFDVLIGLCQGERKRGRVHLWLLRLAPRIQARTEEEEDLCISDCAYENLEMASADLIGSTD